MHRIHQIEKPFSLPAPASSVVASNQKKARCKSRQIDQSGFCCCHQHKADKAGHLRFRSKPEQQCDQHDPCCIIVRVQKPGKKCAACNDRKLPVLYHCHLRIFADPVYSSQHQHAEKQGKEHVLHLRIPQPAIYQKVKRNLRQQRKQTQAQCITSAVFGVAESFGQKEGINRKCHAPHGPQNPEHLAYACGFFVFSGCKKCRDPSVCQQANGCVITQHTDNGNQLQLIAV